MLAEIIRLFVNITFWAHVLGACIAWYILARAIATISFNSGAPAFPASQAGGFYGIIPALFIGAIVEWLTIGSALWTLVHASVVLSIALILMCTLVALEPSRKDQ